VDSYQSVLIIVAHVLALRSVTPSLEYGNETGAPVYFGLLFVLINGAREEHVKDGLP